MRGRVRSSLGDGIASGYIRAARPKFLARAAAGAARLGRQAANERRAVREERRLFVFIVVDETACREIRIGPSGGANAVERRPSLPKSSCGTLSGNPEAPTDVCSLEVTGPCVASCPEAQQRLAGAVWVLGFGQIRYYGVQASWCSFSRLPGFHYIDVPASSPPLPLPSLAGRQRQLLFSIARGAQLPYARSCGFS